MCPKNPPTSSKRASSQEKKGNGNDEILYTLGDHAIHLSLLFETVDFHPHLLDEVGFPKQFQRYWFCDWTKHFVPSPHQHRLVDKVVKEYCQPIRQADLEEMFVGTSSMASIKEDQLAVRTVTIQLRPDCDHIKVFEALNEAFAVIHPRHHQVMKNSDNCFQAVGADGNVPLMLSAQIITSKRIPTLERLVLLRFYHITQVQSLEEVLIAIGGVQTQKSPLREVQTPLNNKLGEACAMLQTIFRQKELVRLLDERQAHLQIQCGSDKGRYKTSEFEERRRSLERLPKLTVSLLRELPSPKNSTRETSRFFMERISESPSVLDENWDRLPVFPSLSNKDYDILQESWPLLDRIWSELELAKCTYNTLIDETSRFGMRPCQPTLDKDYCIQLFQISQQRMLRDLRRQLDQAEATLDVSLNDYADFEQQLNQVIMRTYHMPLEVERHNPLDPSDQTSESLNDRQSPIALPQRDIAEFPWEFEDITLALQDITHTIICICLEQDYDPLPHSLQVCERSIDHIFEAVEKSNECDQQGFLKRRNQHAIFRLSQQQRHLKEVVRKLSNTPSAWQGLPKLQSEVKRWQEIAEQASNKDDARPQSNWVHRKGEDVTNFTSFKKSFQVPLLEFQTKFGMACLTQNTIILLSEIPFLECVKAYEINKVEIVVTPKHSMHKMAIMRHGKRLCGFSPTSMDVNKLEKFVKILKSVQR